MSKKIVIALGGNALGNTPYEQLALVTETAKPIVHFFIAPPYSVKTSSPALSPKAKIMRDARTTSAVSTTRTSTDRYPFFIVFSFVKIFWLYFKQTVDATRQPFVVT